MASLASSAGSSTSTRPQDSEGPVGPAGAALAAAAAAQPLDFTGGRHLVEQAYQEAIERLAPQASQPPPPQQPPPSLQALQALQPGSAGAAPQALQSPATAARSVEESPAASTERQRRPDGQPGSRGSVRVMARMRPSLSGEEDGESCLRVVGQTQLEVLTEPRALLADHRSRRRTTGGITQASWRSMGALDVVSSPRSCAGGEGSPSGASRGGMEARSFSFDTVFGTSVSDDDVFGAVRPEVATALNGEAVCILAYGATGSGKTHTVMNLAERTARELEQQASALEQAGLRLEIMVQIVEIYNEQLRDLLAQDGSHEPPRLKLSVQANMPMLQGATLRTITGDSTPGIAHSLQETFRLGQAQRATSATAVHARSSRSHLVMKLFLSTRDAATGGYHRTGKLSLVDLAGSERLKRSEVQGERLKEAQHINKSLSALADVVTAKDRRMNHVPYRNSKLTHMLQDTLGDQCRTVIIVALPPTRANLDETLYSLQFSARLNCIALEPPRSEASARAWMQEPQLRTLQEDAEGAILVARAEADRLRGENERLRAENEKLRSQVEDRDTRLQQQERRMLDVENRLEETERQLAAQKQLYLELIPIGPSAASAAPAGRADELPLKTAEAMVWPLPGAASPTLAWASAEVPPPAGVAEASLQAELGRTPSLSDLEDNARPASGPCLEAALLPPCSHATPQWGERSLCEVGGSSPGEAGAATALAAAAAVGGEAPEGEEKEAAIASLGEPAQGEKQKALPDSAPAAGSAPASGPDSGAGSGSSQPSAKDLTQSQASRGKGVPAVPTPARARAAGAAGPAARSSRGAGALISPPGRFGAGAAAGGGQSLAARAREAPSSAPRPRPEAEALREPAVASAPALRPAAAVAAAGPKKDARQVEARSRARPQEQDDGEARRSRSASSRGLRGTPRKYVVEVITSQHAKQLAQEGLCVASEAAAEAAAAEARKDPGSPPRSPTLLLMPGNEEDSSCDDSSPRSDSSISLSSNEVDIKHRLGRALHIESQQEEPPSPLSSTVAQLPENAWGYSGMPSGTSNASGSGYLGASVPASEVHAAPFAFAQGLRPVPPLPTFSGSGRDGWANPAPAPAAAAPASIAAVPVRGRVPCSDSLLASGKAPPVVGRAQTKPGSPHGAAIPAPWASQPSPQPTPRQRAAAGAGGLQPQQRSPPRTAQQPPAAAARAPSFSWSPRARYGQGGGRHEPSTGSSARAAAAAVQRGTPSAAGAAPPQTPRREKYVHVVSQVALGAPGARR